MQADTDNIPFAGEVVIVHMTENGHANNQQEGQSIHQRWVFQNKQTRKVMPLKMVVQTIRKTMWNLRISRT